MGEYKIWKHKAETYKWANTVRKIQIEQIKPETTYVNLQVEEIHICKYKSENAVGNTKL